ncbi:type III pantothenate kinase, partial [Candidatus Chrysopegis kryptomonas]
MLLAIDIGNTHTVFGIYQNGKLIHDWRVSSLITRTEDETWLLVKFFCEDAKVNVKEITGVGISSVVPNLTDVFVWMSKKHFKVEPVVVSYELDLGIKILYD